MSQTHLATRFAVAVCWSIALAPLPALATDVPGGPVSGVWDVAGSPYHVLGDLTVPAGEMLTIEPGVEVVFTGSFRLTAAGSVQAVGTAADSIRIYGTVLWERIRLESETQLSEFAYCWIAGAERGINSINSPVSISHCRLSDHVTALDIYGIGNPDPPSVTVSDCRIHECEQHGIFVVENSNTWIEDCEITRCALDGSPRGAIQLSNQSGGGSNNPTITGNWIHHNTWQGITAFDVTGGGRIHVFILENVIEYNLTGVYLLYVTGELRGNQINHNFEDGNPDSGAGLMLYGATATPLLTDNTLTGNFTGLYVVEGATANLGDLNNADPGDDGRNRIHDNIDLNDNTWSVYSNSTADIVAENNIWDSEDYAEIALTIFDGNDNPAFGIVDFDPILDVAALDEEPDMNELGASAILEIAPNPMTRRVRIQLTHDDPIVGETVDIGVYDAAGRLVRRLHRGTIARGGTVFTWDGTHTSGRRVPGGTYFCRVRGESGSESRPVLLLR